MAEVQASMPSSTNFSIDGTAFQQCENADRSVTDEVGDLGTYAEEIVLSDGDGNVLCTIPVTIEVTSM